MEDQVEPGWWSVAETVGFEVQYQRHHVKCFSVANQRKVPLIVCDNFEKSRRCRQAETSSYQISGRNTYQQRYRDEWNYFNGPMLRDQ